jgi:photosystem II stability/assembly factor-like uncharacterized protein
MRSRCFFFLVCSLSLFSVSFIHSENSGVAAHFEHLGPFGGDARSLLVDSQLPNIVYLGTSNGGIFKSSDAGNSWAPLSPGIGKQEYVVDTLVQHPGDHNHIYAGAWDLHSNGGGLFESTDAGLAWTRIALPQTSSAVRGLAICRSDPNRMIVGTLAGAYVSADGGKIWKQVGGSELQKAESVAIDPTDYRFLYVGTWRLGYRSTDFGKTWTRVEKGMPLDSDLFSISINDKDPETLYSSACSGVYRSTNRAQSWTRLRILPDRFTIRAQVVYVDPNSPRRIYTGTTEGLFVSNDDGQTWTILTPNNVIVNAIQIDPTNSLHILIGTEYQGILLSEDGGQTWKESNAGFIHKQISWILPHPADSGRFVAGLLSGGGGWYVYDDRENTWTLSQIEPGVRVLSFLILPKDLGSLAGTSQGLYWQTSKSGPWTKLKGSIGKRTIYCLKLDPGNPVVYAGTDQGIYRASLTSMDFRLPPGYRFSPTTWCISAPRTNSGPVYAGTSLGVLRSWDRGTTWRVVSAYGLPDRAAIGSIAVCPSDKDHLFAGTSVGLFESKNGGIHWKRVDDDRLGVEVPSVVFLDESGKRVLAADKTSGGLFYSLDGGEVWDKISFPGFESPVYCLSQDPEQPSRFYVGTRSDGVYRLSLR